MQTVDRKSKEEILLSHPLLNHTLNKRIEKEILKAMEEYSKQEMIQLIKNISKNPVYVYSEQQRGMDKKYFLGKGFVEDLIIRITDI